MEREKLEKAIKSIAWGYVLLHVNINLGSLNLLPDWLGYVLILGALPILSEAEPSALLLRPLGILLALWEGLVWGLTSLGAPPNFMALGLVAAALSLYFHFQLLTNLSALARQHNSPQEKKLLHLRTVRTLLITVLALPIPWEQHIALTTGMAVVNLIVGFWICSLLFSLRRSLMESATQTETEG